MFLAIGSGIVLNIFLASCRGWFFRTTFGNQYQRQWFLVIGCISSTLLGSFPFFASSLGVDGLYYTTLTSATNRPTVVSLLIALLLIPTIVYLLLGNTPSRKSLLTCLQFVLLGGSIFLFMHGFVAGAFVAWAIVAIVEERTKTTTTLALHDRFAFLSSDIIFFGLLSALSFAVIENFVYLRTLGTDSVGVAVGLVIKRMLTSRIMHLTYTGLIAVGISFCSGFDRRSVQGSGFIVLGILLHTLFNSSLQNTHIGITLLLVICGYLFLSRLLYKSERVYIDLR